MPPAPTLILLDLGGVLVRLKGMPGIAPDVHQLLGRSPSLLDLETGRISGDEYIAGALGDLSLTLSAEAFRTSFLGILDGLYDGAIELIHDLKASGHTVAALSNTNALHWPILIHDLGLANAFDHMFASHLIGAHKPHPAIYLTAIQTLGCEPGSALFFDDRIENVEGARRVGIRSWQANSPQEVSSILADELRP